MTRDEMIKKIINKSGNKIFNENLKNGIEKSSKKKFNEMKIELFKFDEEYEKLKKIIKSKI
jgi:hypothetical protein